MSRSESILGSREFRWRCFRFEVVSTGAALILVWVYLATVPGLGPSEAIALFGSLCSAALIVGALVALGLHDRLAPIVRHLDGGSDALAEDVRRETARRALESIRALPTHLQRTKWLLAGVTLVFVPLAMWLLGFEDWLGGARLRSLGTIAFAGFGLGGVFGRQWAKQAWAGLRSELASIVGDRDSAGDDAVPRSFQRRGVVGVLVFALAAVLLVIDVVSLEVRDLAAKDAAALAGVALEAVASGDPDLPIPERIAHRSFRMEEGSLPIEFAEIHAEPFGQIASAGLSEAFVDALDAQLELGRSAGRIVPSGGGEVGAYRRLDGGSILVASIRRTDLPHLGVIFRPPLLAVVLGILVGAAVLGGLGAREIDLGLAALRSGLVRMQEGDFSAGAIHDADDEFGTLARSLDGLRDSIRSRLSRLIEAGREFDRLGSDISLAIETMAAVSGECSRKTQHASRMMDRVGAFSEEASRSSEDLKNVVDGSEHAILELAAAGEQLRETASVLTEKADAVSESMEQMVGSVKQVAGTADRLAAASEETSSSMEEMASAMRAVDTSAETTANLSRDVVKKAELGQAKVVQTIEGMEAIREATEAAERVIRGLGARTKEIGGILDVIDDVADETNLLALNAAIIAAQAGEQGKAFSVVADEIKELADRVLASTKEIGGLIRAVQAESENAIGAIEAGSISVMSGVDLSAEAGRTLEEITVASRESGSRISEILASVREQTKAASHVVSLMERVRDSAEQIGVAGMQQERGNEVIYRSALTMREVAQQVRATTEEQTRGFGQIRENVDAVRHTVDRISQTLDDQSSGCQEIKVVLDSLAEGSTSHDEVLEQVRRALRKLTTQAQGLRDEAERIRLE
ncbi:MAG TPA: methyl-accepting chemotaxis protein [Deltaproteobacteria bacterium]|nr:methyl-accepting chemotaxis protein [Deltaproteobacteria bacterium]